MAVQRIASIHTMKKKPLFGTAFFVSIMERDTGIEKKYLT